MNFKIDIIKQLEEQEVKIDKTDDSSHILRVIQRQLYI